jgi:hypothetical protein
VFSGAARTVSTNASTSAVASDAVTFLVQVPFACHPLHRSWKRYTPWVCSTSSTRGSRWQRPCRSVRFRCARTTSR